MFNSAPLPLGSSNALSCEQWFAFPNLTMVTYMCVCVRPWCRVVWWTYGGGVVWCRSMWCDVVWFGVHTVVVWCGVVPCDVMWCGVVWCTYGGVVWFGVHTVVWCGSVVNHCHRQEVTPLVSPLHELPSSVPYKWGILSFDIAQCTLTPIISFKLFGFLCTQIGKGCVFSKSGKHFCWWFCQQDSGFVHKVR